MNDDRWYETEELELGSRVTGYAVLVDLFPDSCGIDPTMRARVEPGKRP